MNEIIRTILQFPVEHPHLNLAAMAGIFVVAIAVMLGKAKQ